jgi:hypothetical protein
MAIKILSQIGTDSGITSEAYVRIHEYNISKSGAVNLQLQIFLSENLKSPVRNKLIGDSLVLDLSRDEIITETKKVSSTIGDFSPTPPQNSEGLTVMPSQLPELEEKEIVSTSIIKIVDLSELESSNLFEFGYNKLRAYLISIFGIDNVLDC